MNTPPSPEAKQAAEKIISHTGANHFDLVVTMDYVQQAIDAATSKLREENDKLRSEYCPCYTYVDGDTDPDCPMHGTHGKSLLKTTTPEVEKIARETVRQMQGSKLLYRDKITTSCAISHIHSALRDVAAQAREPLVARIAQMEQWLADVGYSAEEMDKALESYRWVKAPAGTGEAKK